MPFQARGGSRSSSSGRQSGPDLDLEQGRHAGKKVRRFFRVQHWKRPATPIDRGQDQDGTGIWEKGPGSSRRKKSPVFFQFRVFFRMTRKQGGARTQGVAGREDHRGARGGHFRLPEENGARVLAGNALLTLTLTLTLTRGRGREEG